MRSTFIFGLEQIFLMSKVTIKKIGRLIIKRNSFERNQDLILQIYEPLRKEK